LNTKTKAISAAIIESVDTAEIIRGFKGFFSFLYFFKILRMSFTIERIIMPPNPAASSITAA